MLLFQSARQKAADHAAAIRASRFGSTAQLSTKTVQNSACTKHHQHAAASPLQCFAPTSTFLTEVLFFILIPNNGGPVSAVVL